MKFSYKVSLSSRKSLRWLRNSPLVLNTRAYYRVHTDPSLTTTLSQLNPLHTFTYYIFKVKFRFILPSTSRSPKWSTSLRLSC